MVFARLAEYFSPGSPSLATESRHPTLNARPQDDSITDEKQDAGSMAALEEEKRHPLLHVRLSELIRIMKLTLRF